MDVSLESFLKAFRPGQSRFETWLNELRRLNFSPSKQPALTDHTSVSPFRDPRIVFISCSPIEPYILMHHVFGITFRLNQALSLYLHHHHCQSQHIIFIRLLSISISLFLSLSLSLSFTPGFQLTIETSSLQELLL